MAIFSPAFRLAPRRAPKSHEPKTNCLSPKGSQCSESSRCSLWLTLLLLSADSATLRGEPDFLPLLAFFFRAVRFFSVSSAVQLLPFSADSASLR